MPAETVEEFGCVSLFLLSLVLLCVCVCRCVHVVQADMPGRLGGGTGLAPSAAKISVRVGGDDPRLTRSCPTPLASAWRRLPSQEALLLRCLLTGREKSGGGRKPAEAWRGSCPAVDDAHHHQATPPVLTALGLDVRLQPFTIQQNTAVTGRPTGGRCEPWS